LVLFSPQNRAMFAELLDVWDIFTVIPSASKKKSFYY
jgi:hypothetical protein